MKQRNFILTDVMKTGQPAFLKHFIDCGNLPEQQFVITEEYYTIHNYDLKSFDRRLAIIDMSFNVNTVLSNSDYQKDLKHRLKVLHDLGFSFIFGCPWESKDNLHTQNWLNAEWTLKGERVVPYTYHTWTGGSSWFWSYMMYKHQQQNFKFDHTDKKYDMLYLNKFPREHRIKLFDKIKDTNLLDNSLYSFIRLKEPIRLPSEYELPWVDAKDYPLIGSDQDLYERPYNDTKFSLISETNDNNNEVFITEKIWKAIIAKHVFVVHGNLGYLKKLQALGFQTFSKCFDESYDDEHDKDKRIEKIMQACVEVNKQDWKMLYAQTREVRQHNYNTFFDKSKLSLEINKELSLWLEFVDGSQVSSTKS